MKTTLLSQIDNHLNLDKTFYVSGYANPNMRSKPKCNIKPVQVTFVKNNPARPHRTGLYYVDRNLEKLIAKSVSGQIIPPNENTFVFNDYDSALQHYNEEVQSVADQYEKQLKKVLGNKI